MENETKPNTGKGSAKGGRPRKELDVAAVLASPEGQQAIAAAAAAAAGPILREFEDMKAKLTALPLAAGSGGYDLQTILSQLSMNMAAVSDQGSQRVRIDPEEQLKRDAAKARMGNLLIDAAEKYKDARYRGDEQAMDANMPIYQVIVPTHIADRLVQPFTDFDGIAEQTTIDWQGAPGPSMRPVNEIAILIFEQYETWIGGIPDTINGQAAQPQWVRLGRDGSMAVRTTPGARYRDGGSRRQVGGMSDSGELPGTESGPAFALRRRAANTSSAAPRHILGTAVPPARDMSPGEPRRV